LRRSGSSGASATVDRSEWHMTPQTVNAYFNPSQNEIVFPAGILQPPFFDLAMDDAVNYGGIGAVIGHEITHGYDDQGRKYDADGNLNDWWTKADAAAFEAQSAKGCEAVQRIRSAAGRSREWGTHAGENIADLGGVSIAYEALQRRAGQRPGKAERHRRAHAGTTVLRLVLRRFGGPHCRDAEARRLVTVDPHSPGRFRCHWGTCEPAGVF